MGAALRSTTINLRAPAEKKALIDRAAEALGKSRTDFMLDTLCQKAHEILADRSEFRLNGQDFAAFNRLLDKPVNEAALRMLSKRAPWE